MSWWNGNSDDVKALIVFGSVGAVVAVCVTVVHVVKVVYGVSP